MSIRFGDGEGKLLFISHFSKIKLFQIIIATTCDAERETQAVIVQHDHLHQG